MIACLSIPYFVAAVERRAGRGASAEPLACLLYTSDAADE